jgi:hypothetical protein
MNRLLKVIPVSLAIGIPAFLIGPQLWPMSTEVPPPPPDLLPAYMALAAIEALAFGLAVAFVLFGWSNVRGLRLGPSWLNAVLYVSIAWLLGNWWIHDNLHMHVALDMGRLLYIEYGFHLTLLACGAVLAVSFLLLARGAPHSQANP